MSKLRELIKSDRVKIIGPWLQGEENCGQNYIGQFATVIDVISTRGWMPIVINIDGDVPVMTFAWDRETLRALPRKATQTPQEGDQANGK